MSLIKKQLANIDSRIDKIDAKNIKLEHTIHFTTNTDYEFIVNIIKNDRIFKTYNVKDAEQLDKLANKLQEQYNVPMQANYSSLTDNQLRYLIEGLNTDTGEIDLQPRAYNVLKGFSQLAKRDI